MVKKILIITDCGDCIHDDWRDDGSGYCCLQLRRSEEPNETEVGSVPDWCPLPDYVEGAACRAPTEDVKMVTPAASPGLDFVTKRGR